MTIVAKIKMTIDMKVLESYLVPVLGAGAGVIDWTSITNFWLKSAQCSSTPQMYHFLPGVIKVTTSFPDVRPVPGGGIVQVAKELAFTLYTLCTFTGYLNTESNKKLCQL